MIFNNGMRSVYEGGVYQWAMDSNIGGGRFPADTVCATILFDIDKKIKEIEFLTMDLHKELNWKVQTMKEVKEIWNGY